MFLESAWQVPPKFFDNKQLNNLAGIQSYLNIDFVIPELLFFSHVFGICLASFSKIF
jgi:hypothetical protein